eukprot:3933935-Rhodomonas_salina.1
MPRSGTRVPGYMYRKAPPRPVKKRVEVRARRLASYTTTIPQLARSNLVLLLWEGPGGEHLQHLRVYPGTPEY